jgi:hypothetical protein
MVFYKRVTLVIVNRFLFARHISFDVKFRFIEQIEKSKSYWSLLHSILLLLTCRSSFLFELITLLVFFDKFLVIWWPVGNGLVICKFYIVQFFVRIEHEFVKYCLIDKFFCLNPFNFLSLQSRCKDRIGSSKSSNILQFFLQKVLILKHSAFILAFLPNLFILLLNGKQIDCVYQKTFFK